jgi:hypothetical protein
VSRGAGHFAFVRPAVHGTLRAAGIALSRLIAVSGAVWGSALAILILLIGPVLQKYWGLGPEEPLSQRLTYLRTMLAVSGRLAVRWLRILPVRLR